jgi:release factor glutamine methyltransferase
MILQAMVRRGRAELAEAGIPAPEAAMDADLLARHALGWDLPTLVARSGEEAPDSFEDRFEALIARRRRREPMAYIRGTQEFWGRDFLVRPGVLVPRPETEFVIDEALAWAATRAPGTAPRILDIGTGSGCLAITLALELAAARVAGTDVSPEALQIARENAGRLDTAVTFHLGSYLANAELPVDLLVSNPPYVTTGDYATIQPEVRDFEPIAALVAGDDGLDAIRGVVHSAATALTTDGLLLMEIGFGQAEEVERLISRRAELTFLGIREDLQGVPRIAKAIRRRPIG